MKLTFKAAGRLQKTPLVIVFVSKAEKPALPAGVEVAPGFTKAFDAEPRATRTTFASGGPAERVLLVGLGERKWVDPEGLRRASAVAVKQAEGMGVGAATLHVHEKLAGLAGGAPRVGRALAEGALLGAYRFQDGKSEKKPAKLKSAVIQGAGSDLKRGVQHGKVLAEANAYTRDLQNLPGNEMTPRAMAAEANKLAKRSPRITCKVLDEPAMKKLGMGMLLSVSRGSEEPARFIHLVYKPKTTAKKSKGSKGSKGRVCFVGKGLTFDAGGISLKPASKMEDMRYDMSGGAAVLGAFHALASIDVPFEVHGIVPSSENLPDGKATKPGDIFTAMNGKTVEVLNTDAEGRLILGDALCYAMQKVKPDTIIDLATLTGAVVSALGHELSGMFATTDRLRDTLTAAGEATGELVWPLPLLDVHKQAMKGVVADLKNISGPALGAGSTAGAAFLSAFVGEDVEWCHLDIAGAAWGGEARDWVGGATGSGVGTRLLIEYLEQRNKRVTAGIG